MQNRCNIKEIQRKRHKIYFCKCIISSGQLVFGSSYESSIAKFVQAQTSGSHITDNWRPIKSNAQLEVNENCQCITLSRLKYRAEINCYSNHMIIKIGNKQSKRWLSSWSYISINHQRWKQIVRRLKVTTSTPLASVNIFLNVNDWCLMSEFTLILHLEDAFMKQYFDTDISMSQR